MLGWGGRELILLYGSNQYIQNRDNSGLLGTPVYYSLKLGGDCTPPPPHYTQLINTCSDLATVRYMYTYQLILSYSGRYMSVQNELALYPL